MYTIGEAQANWAKLVRQAERGKEIVIARGDTPIAKLVPVEKARARSVWRVGPKSKSPRNR